MATSVIHIPNREAWLNDCAEGLREAIQKASGTMIPPFRVSCGWPTRKALSQKNRTIGQCWDGMISGDGTAELFISPVIAEPLEVAATLGHELIHAAVGTAVGHKGPFKKAALGIGLKGKMTATVPGDLFIATAEPILKQLGKYPHAAMVPNAKHKAAGTRMLKVFCGECGYTIRTTAKWIEEKGTPFCACNGERMTAPEGFDSEGGERDE